MLHHPLCTDCWLPVQRKRTGRCAPPAAAASLAACRACLCQPAMDGARAARCSACSALGLVMVEAETVQREEAPACMEWWCAVGRSAIGNQILLAAQHALVSVGW